MTLLIVFNDGTERRVENVMLHEDFDSFNCFAYTKKSCGYWAFVPKENVRYFGPEELWIEPEKNADWDKIIECVESCRLNEHEAFDYNVARAQNNLLNVVIAKLKRMREEK